jgi:hypothetical protein
MSIHHVVADHSAESAAVIEYGRLQAGKSAIHGWGAFTKRPHAASDMLIEYMGELVRRPVADARERRVYDTLVGAGTYVFGLTDELVVDATRQGDLIDDSIGLGCSAASSSCADILL